MDSFEFSKISAAVLTALLLIFGTPVLLKALRGGYDDHSVQVAYKLPDPPDAGSTEATAPAVEEGFQFQNVATLFSEASIDSGQGVFKKCSNCHTVNEGGRNGIGPNLWNVVGRGLGAVEGFNYSSALVEKGGVWDYEDLAKFLHKPKEYISGTKMAFGGLRSDKDIANVLKYLQSLSSDPKPLPEPAAATPADTEAAAPAQEAEAAPATEGGDAAPAAGTGDAAAPADKEAGQDKPQEKPVTSN